MDTRKLAEDARAMLAAGKAVHLTEAIQLVVVRALRTIAGTYTVQAERQWIGEVTRVERATRT